MFYDKLFSSLDFTLPKAATGRRGFPKEAMVCAFIVMKCEGFSQITDLADYLDNNRLIAHYCGFNIMEPLPSYWTYDRFLRQLDNSALKSIMADLVKKLYEIGIVDASFIGLDSTPVAANTKQNNPKSFNGQAGALHPEGGRLPVHRFHPQDRPHPAGEIGRGCTLHLCLQQDTAAIVGVLDRIPFCLRGTGQHKAQHCPQNQADAIAPGRTFAQTARQRPQQTDNKKCRKRHKTSRLRQKGAHQLQPQRSCAENTERAAHLT